MTRPRRWTDDALMELEREVRGCLDGGDAPGAAGLVVKMLGPSVHGYLRTLLVEGEIEDAFSEFSENLLKALPTFRWECPLRAWAYRIAFHSAARIWRSPGRHLEEPLPSALSRLGAGSGRSVPGASGRHAGLALLREHLSLEDQTLLKFRVDLELPWEEIAAALGSDDGERGSYAREAAALRKRYERLTARLREEARRHGLID